MRMLINKNRIISITYHKKVINSKYKFHKKGEKIWNGLILPICLDSDCFTCEGETTLFDDKALNERNCLQEGELVYYKPYIDIYYSCTSICNDHEKIFFNSEEEMFNFNLESNIDGFINI